jgi:hypothetical protein
MHRGAGRPHPHAVVHFSLAQYVDPETPTGQDPNNPIQDFHQKILPDTRTPTQKAQLEDAGQITNQTNWLDDLKARLERLNLKLVQVGPTIYNDKVVIMVGVEEAIPPRLQEQFDAEMNGLGQGYPMVLRHQEPIKG